MLKLSEKYIHNKIQRDIFMGEGVWTKVRINYIAGLILTQDVHIEAKEEYNNGYPCFEKVGFGKYKFIGFQE